MKLSIRWSPRSVEDINRHLDYLEENWDRNVTNKVLDRIDEVLSIIAANPQLYPSFERNGNVYRCVISK